MARYLRAYDCTDCGRTTERMRDTGQALVCLTCANKRTVTAALSMANKSGPAYDRWQQTPGPRGRPKSTK